ATSDSILSVVSVIADDTDVSRSLKRLADLGLVRFSRADGGRYSMLEPVRQIVAAGLDADTEHRLGAAHTAHFVDIVRQAHAVFQMIGADQDPWYRRLEVEQANLRAMLEWGLDRSDPTVLGAVPGL